MSEEGNQSTTTDAFERFLLIEYTNLAQAFFSAGATLTQFFQYYLLALGVPLTAAGIAIKVSDNTLDLQAVMVAPTGRVLGFVFLVIGFVGVCMAAYIMNLRIDALLYAHSVNGIRGYFYNLPGLRDGVHKYRVPSTDTEFPPFLETWSFIPVVTAFALLNSAYLASGLALVLKSMCAAALLGTVALVAHYGIYWLIAERRAASNKATTTT